jgi:hypothetical protein
MQLNNMYGDVHNPAFDVAIAHTNTTAREERTESPHISRQPTVSQRTVITTSPYNIPNSLNEQDKFRKNYSLIVETYILHTRIAFHCRFCLHPAPQTFNRDINISNIRRLKLYVYKVKKKKVKLSL